MELREKSDYASYNLEAWLAFLENRSPIHEIQLGLSRINSVATQMNLLKQDATVITVAGTNGKGSTVTMLETLYRSAGYQVGTYTSPHLLYFNERIRINQRNISDEDLCQAFCAIEAQRQDIHLTYFEMTTLAALWYFKKHDLDMIILEVGIGGRHDATNIIDSDLSMITTVDYDHQSLLGDTIEAIGYEKAGILRANKTLIYSDTTMPQSVLDCAKQLNVQVIQVAKDYSYDIVEDKFLIKMLNGERYVLPKPKIHFQAAAAAIIAADHLREILPIHENAIKKACESVKIAGRLQFIYDTICTVLDVSHNPQSVALLKQCIQSIPKAARVHAVFSGLKDKDLYGLIEPMHSMVDKWYSAKLETKRAASESTLREIFNRVSPSIEVNFSASITDAYRAALENAREGDLIIVYGSFYVVSPIMFDNREKRGWLLCNG